MKLSWNLVLTFLLLILISSLYRVMPGRPWGFAPQIAMAIFGGAVIKDKKFAFLLPILSMFFSDAIYEMLYRNDIVKMPGFYSGQITNYFLFASMTIFGFIITKINFLRILFASIAAPSVYFLVSNFLVWAGGGGLQRPKSFSGLLMCYNDGWPFFGWSVAASLIFSAILFGGYLIIKRSFISTDTQLA